MGSVPIRQFWWSVRIDPSEGTHTNWWKNSSTAAASMAKRALSRHIARHCRGIRVRDFCLSYWNICLRKFLTITLIFSNSAPTISFFDYRYCSLEDHEKKHLPYLREDNCQQILHSHCPLSFDSISPYTDDVWASRRKLNAIKQYYPSVKCYHLRTASPSKAMRNQLQLQLVLQQIEFFSSTSLSILDYLWTQSRNIKWMWP